MFTIAALYHLTPWPTFAAHQKPWKEFLISQHVTGTILLTPEGINGTIAGPAAGIEAVLAFIRSHQPFAGLIHKISHSDTNPFPRTKIKLKKETIPLGTPVDFAHVGTYVTAEQWNTLISDPRTFLVDTRNDYEFKIGKFEGALNPQTRTFKELPAWLSEHLPADKTIPVAMYCTGGIRCEKSTAYLKQQGYQNVYHLHGGILKYLEDMPQAQSKWQGDCYVFDDRVAVNHNLEPAKAYQICKTCNNPIIAADHQRSNGQNPCPHCHPRT